MFNLNEASGLPTGYLTTTNGEVPYKLSTNSDGAGIIIVGDSGYKDAYLDDMLTPFEKMDESQVNDLAHLLSLGDVGIPTIQLVQKACLEFSKIRNLLDVIGDEEWIFNPRFFRTLGESDAFFSTFDESEV